MLKIMGIEHSFQLGEAYQFHKGERIIALF